MPVDETKKKNAAVVLKELYTVVVKQSDAKVQG
jgi:hypothetical protein